MEKLVKESALAWDSLDFAKHLDSLNPNKRSLFHIPKSNGKESVYLCGNSLGLQPKSLAGLVTQELQVWQDSGVNGHFDHPHNRPWVSIDDILLKESARIIESEVAILNTLTTNLHFMMIPFYRPTPTRFKIIMEAKAFPSDYFAIASQVKLHGLDPDLCIIQIAPKAGNHILETSQILEVIEQHGAETCLMLMSGVQFYTGQLFDIKTITEKAKSLQIYVGWDLAHAVGNVLLELHEWNVDFACWCTYKYLNSGPGNIGGLFVHSSHDNRTMPQLSGWWGQDPASKFEMSNAFEPIKGAYGYRLSNPSVLCCISLFASLEIYKETSMQVLVDRSRLLTAYLEMFVDSMGIQILTPRNPVERGCQLSLKFNEGQMEVVFNKLSAQGVICDERKPDVLRVSPTPLYNTFEDIWRFSEILKQNL